jgi:hypothetical protein
MRLLRVFPSLTRIARNGPSFSAALVILMLPFISKASEQGVQRSLRCRHEPISSLPGIASANGITSRMPGFQDTYRHAA